jgi:hypothetical protein
VSTLFASQWVKGVGRVFVALFGSPHNILANMEPEQYFTGRVPSNANGLYRIIDSMREPDEMQLLPRTLTHERYENDVDDVRRADLERVKRLSPAGFIDQPIAGHFEQPGTRVTRGLGQIRELFDRPTDRILDVGLVEVIELAMQTPQHAVHEACGQELFEDLERVGFRWRLLVFAIVGGGHAGGAFGGPDSVFLGPTFFGTGRSAAAGL